MTIYETYEAYLAQRGIRFTEARRLVLNTIYLRRAAFDPEDLFAEISPPRLSAVGTIIIRRPALHRILGELVECGLIAKRVAAGQVRYELPAK